MSGERDDGRHDPQHDGGPDEATRAFDHLSAEIAVLRRAVERMDDTVAQSARERPVDYGGTLKAMNVKLGRLAALVDEGTGPATITGRFNEATEAVRKRLEGNTAAREREAEELAGEARRVLARAEENDHRSFQRMNEADRTLKRQDARNAKAALIGAVVALALAAGAGWAVLGLAPAWSGARVMGIDGETARQVLWCRDEAAERAVAIECEIGFQP